MEFLIRNKKYTYSDINLFVKKYLYKFNYYKNLNNLGKKKLCDDIGWSCTIKSVQMMIAFFISLNFKSSKEYIIDLLYNENGLLSIYNFITTLNNHNYDEGKHLGSYLISKIFQTIINQSNNIPFMLYVTDDNILDITTIDFSQNNIYLYSTRLGLDLLNKTYYSLIENCFSINYFLGFIGGVGTSSYYFFGYEPKTQYLLYLDPHIVTKYNPGITLKKICAKNYSIIHISKLNPSITFCFYSTDSNNFIKMKKILEKKTCFNILNKVDYNINLQKKKQKEDNWEML